MAGESIQEIEGEQQAQPAQPAGFVEAQVTDIAPAIRKKQMLEAERIAREEEQLRIEEKLKEELERDPDQLDEEARQNVYMDMMARKQAKNDATSTTAREIRNFKQPKITLGTVLQ